VLVYSDQILLELNNSYSIYSLGDSALTVEWGTSIDAGLNNLVLSVASQLTRQPFAGLKDIVPAYSSLTVYYDPIQVLQKSHPVSASQWVREQIREACALAPSDFTPDSQTHRIPVCYDPEFGTDLPSLSEQLSMPIEEIISLHVSLPYRVYMIGFMPGFPYLGELPASLATARKQKPVSVKAGSVAIAGNQTGIYPFESPGGWNVIGITSFKLFDAHNSIPVPMKAGDMVEFYRINRDEYLAQVT